MPRFRKKWGLPLFFSYYGVKSRNLPCLNSYNLQARISDCENGHQKEERYSSLTKRLIELCLTEQGTSGNVRNYITRTQAVRKLQLSLPDFRRLCIFKGPVSRSALVQLINSNTYPGIYPREPRNRKKASKSATPSTTFYYARDIQYLLHEPLINKFREHKALAKKIGRALGKGAAGDAARLEKNKSRITLDHIIKERYPTFVDAVRDLDDALSMLFLFANLPSTTYVAPKTIALCQRLCLEFEHYLIVTHSLRKSFLSIKGIYYQATVQGQDILWLVPYRFVQKMEGDIDFRIMGTFIEFYTTLLGFVNYRLYTSVGLVYPPKFNSESDNQGGELGAFRLEGKDAQLSIGPSPNGTNGNTESRPSTHNAQEEADKIAQVEDNQPEEVEETDAIDDNDATETIDKFEPATTDGADILPQPVSSERIASQLFEPFTFFISRETPRAPLEFILKAFGCKRVGWDTVLGDGAFTTDEKDPNITHQIVDRPSNIPAVSSSEQNGESNEISDAPSGRPRVAGRTYVQPQWVWDCVNEGALLRPDLYAPGATLPPHLSPWVKPKKGQYDPTAPLAGQEKEDEAQLHEEDMEAEDGDEDEIEVSADVQMDGIDLHDRLISGTEDMDEDDDEDDEDSQDDGSSSAQNSPAAPAGAECGGLSGDESEMSETEAEAQQHQRELEAEALGLPFTTTDAGQTPARAISETRKKVQKRRKEEQEELDRRRMMLPNKKRRLFDAMTYSNQQKDVAAEKLRKKRRKLEKTARAT